RTLCYSAGDFPGGKVGSDWILQTSTGEVTRPSCRSQRLQATLLPSAERAVAPGSPDGPPKVACSLPVATCHSSTNIPPPCSLKVAIVATSVFPSGVIA